MKNSDYQDGVRDMLRYVQFCYTHYIFRLNVAGILEFIDDFISMLIPGAPLKIRNQYDYDFWEWATQRRGERGC